MMVEEKMNKEKTKEEKKKGKKEGKLLKFKGMVN